MKAKTARQLTKFCSKLNYDKFISENSDLITSINIDIYETCLKGDSYVQCVLDKGIEETLYLIKYFSSLGYEATYQAMLSDPYRYALQISW